MTTDEMTKRLEYLERLNAIYKATLRFHSIDVDVLIGIARDPERTSRLLAEMREEKAKRA